jgi:hypothetical protein
MPARCPDDAIPCTAKIPFWDIFLIFNPNGKIEKNLTRHMPEAITLALHCERWQRVDQ